MRRDKLVGVGGLNPGWLLTATAAALDHWAKRRADATEGGTVRASIIMFDNDEVRALHAELAGRDLSPVLEGIRYQLAEWIEADDIAQAGSN